MRGFHPSKAKTYSIAQACRADRGNPHRPKPKPRRLPRAKTKKSDFDYAGIDSRHRCSIAFGNIVCRSTARGYETGCYGISPLESVYADSRTCGRSPTEAAVFKKIPWSREDQVQNARRNTILSSLLISPPSRCARERVRRRRQRPTRRKTRLGGNTATRRMIPPARPR